MLLNWFTTLVSSGNIAQTILLLSTTVFIGLLLKNIKIAGISLGITWILFVGLFLGQFEFIGINSTILHFVKELGLIFFVYAIGMKMGPSFFSSFKNGGVKMNVLAATLVLLNVLAAIIISHSSGLDLPSVVGIMTGAVTNTPSLGAAQQTFSDTTGQSADFISAGYAIAYPFGVVGSILIFCLIKHFFHDSQEEMKKEEEDLDIYTIELQNPSCFGIKLSELKRITDLDFVVTRLYHTMEQRMETPTGDSILMEGDRIFVVSKKNTAKNLELCTGVRIDMDDRSWDKLGDLLICKKAIISDPKVNGKKFGDLNLKGRFGVNVSRIIRTGISLIPTDNLRLCMGDTLIIVGEDFAVKKAVNEVGNSSRKLNDPYLIQIFLGIAVGVLLGSIPIAFPLLPMPVKLGLAGGPLIVAILISSFGNSLGIITYSTSSAKKLLQEMGISLFLAAVGLTSGKAFVSTLLVQGWSWFLFGAIITSIPMIIVALISRYVAKLKGHQILGLLSGATTDPAALAYANLTDKEERPSLSYATVYPLSMFLRIIVAQLMILSSF